MGFLKEALELRKSLSAAAHLIHGSSEGRFTITYCPAGLTKEEIEGGNASSRYETGMFHLDGPLSFCRLCPHFHRRGTRGITPPHCLLV